MPTPETTLVNRATRPRIMETPRKETGTIWGNGMNNQGRVISVFPCLEQLTRVQLGRLGLRYEQIVTVMYTESKDYRGNITARPFYSVSETDNQYEGFFDFIPPYYHQTSDIGRCGCTSGLEGKRRNPCREFGIFKGTPEELKDNSELTREGELRLKYLDDMDLKEKERKEVAREKAKEKAREKAREKAEKKRNVLKQYRPPGDLPIVILGPEVPVGFYS